MLSPKCSQDFSLFKAPLGIGGLIGGLAGNPKCLIGGFPGIDATGEKTTEALQMLEEAEESPGGTIGASAIGKGADVLGRSFFVDFLHCSLPGHQWKCAPKHPQNTRI